MSLPCFFLVFLPFLAQSSLAFTPFADALDPFPSHAWKVFGGTWSVSDGGLNVEGGEGHGALLNGVDAGDFQLDLELRTGARGARAGVVFRGTGMDGEMAASGYEATLTAGENLLTWGARDPSWRAIASRPLAIAPATWYHLRIRAAGENVKIYLSDRPVTDNTWPVFDGIDPAFTKGGLALYAPAGPASFRNFRIQPYQPGTLGASYTNPVQAGCADPVVLHHGGKYYAYTTHTAPGPQGTARGIRLHTSGDLVHWKDEGFAVQDKDSWGKSRYWAPDIVEKDGTFYLYYATDERMCVATARSPMGPFRQEKKQPMLPESIRIDGHVFTDDDGRSYFYYVAFNDGNEIWGGTMNDDMLGVDPASLRLMVKPDQPWERHQAPVTEGPEMIKHKGTYYLTYSGSHFKNPEYAVGYATSASPLGPWKKYEFNPVMKSTAYARGTAHHCFTGSPDGKEMFIIYHRHLNAAQADPRQLSIDRVRFVPNPGGGPDVLEVHGPTSSPQPMPSGAR